MANPGTEIDLTNGERALHVRFKCGDETQVEERLRGLDRGKSTEPYFEVTFRRMEDSNLVTRPTSLQLLRAIVRENPSSIRETAGSSIEASDSPIGTSRNSKNST
ncbi:hypothetical protein BRC86_08915 [Halobacteriales archaeon QS_3_64_16]|nr:MAG: hypothetical protein BRC86_08915 [Halobacteriales archaeon QS_3_64_16]